MDGKIYDLKDRTFKFAQRVMDIVEILPHKPQCEVLSKQLAKSGTSIGANIEEADGTITKKDFLNKMAIARKEAKETRYWLRIISGRYLKEEELLGDISECYELVSILSSIINKTK
jgi:four helix bundle protein